MMMAPEVERPDQIGRPWQYLGEEHQHGDAHADLGHDDRQGQRTLQRRLEREAEPPEQQGR